MLVSTTQCRIVVRIWSEEVWVVTRSRTIQLLLDDVGVFMLLLVTALMLVLAAVFVAHRNAKPVPRTPTVSATTVNR